MTWWWLTSERMTCTVQVDEDSFITTAPPILQKFKGQPLVHLIGWMSKQPGFDAVRMEG